MTIIAAIHDSKTKTTWVGSDTDASYSGCRVHFGPKWHINGKWAVGLAGDGAAHNLLEQHSDRLFYNLSSAHEFTIRLRDIFKEADFDLKPADGQAPPNSAQDILLANHDEVWIVPATFASFKAPWFWAQGAGLSIALGAAYAAENLGETCPQTILALAIGAAINLSTGCGGEIWVRKLGQDFQEGMTNG